MKAMKKNGFSLVELVIVMVIIGVLAAIAIPRISRGAKGAGESALVGDLSVLRNAIELYSSEHNGVYPGDTGDLAKQLTQYTNEDGDLSATPAATHPFGPYLRKGMPAAPVGANKGASDVTVITDASTALTVAGTTGWVYNCKTGEIIVNSDSNNQAGTKTFDAY